MTYLKNHIKKKAQLVFVSKWIYDLNTTNFVIKSPNQLSALIAYQKIEQFLLNLFFSQKPIRFGIPEF